MRKFELKNFKIILSLLLIFSSIPGFSQSYIEGSLMGQLGNQLFIIAATYSLALDHNATPVFPDLTRNKQYNIPLNFEKIFFHLNTSPIHRLRYVYQEPHFEYAPIPFRPNMRICGYFQSEKYFINHKAEILELFAPSEEIHEYLLAKYYQIIESPNTVSVHMRSYYKEDPKGKVHITYGREYVLNAMDLFPGDTLFIVFSNDMNWCKKQLSGISKYIYFVEGENYHHDFYLMSMCKNHIICNSSFSWWAAYLNRNPDKVVVAPKVWFNPSYGLNTKDLIPESWKLID